MANWKTCKTHGPEKPGVWGCPECLRELREENDRLCAELHRVTTERNSAEKREYDVLGRANALAGELKATQARLDKSDDLLREEFARRQDLLCGLRGEGLSFTEPQIEAISDHLRSVGFDLSDTDADKIGLLASAVLEALNAVPNS